MALKIKEEKMNIREPAKDEEIVATFENIHIVDVNISAEQLRKEDLKDKVNLLNFMKTHCHCTPYIFQVKTEMLKFRLFLLHESSYPDYT